MKYSVKTKSIVTTYDEDWWTVDADSVEEAMQKIIDCDMSVEYVDYSCSEVQDRDFIDTAKWVYKKVENE